MLVRNLSVIKTPPVLEARLPLLLKQLRLPTVTANYGRLAKEATSSGQPNEKHLGKTYIAISLGLAACQQSCQVRFFTAAGLVNTLLVTTNPVVCWSGNRH